MKHHLPTLCGKNAQFLHVTLSGTRSYHEALNGYYTANLIIKRVTGDGSFTTDYCPTFILNVGTVSSTRISRRPLLYYFLLLFSVVGRVTQSV
jgi:hypothetical protein